MNKGRIAIVMVMVILLSLVTVSAQERSTSFEDVASDHWAKDAIELMATKGVISGYDGYFRPDDTVSRAEIAKMLVKTLELDEVTPSSPYFKDVAKSDWEYTYVESARNYLTGFTSGSGYNFKPDAASVREDMAVAVIRGLFDKGQVSDPDATDLSVLDDYNDEGGISTNLRKYVAAAINEGIMVGSGGNFEPMGNLTRAEAATLLARLIDDEEKVVFEDGNKVVVGDDESDGDYTAYTSTNSKTPVLTADVGSGHVDLDWSETAASGFKYYKVVLSSSDSTPSYSENGYAKAISKLSSSQWEIESGDAYNGGDMNGIIKGGSTYYVAITAVYDDGHYTSNVKQVTIPGSYVEVSSDDKTPELTYSLGTSGVELSWTQVPSSNFSYYKVVLSQSVSSPYYPDYGYLTYLSDPSTTSYYVQEGAYYKDGSKGGIGGAVEDEQYYMTITAVYKDGKYTSNSVLVTVPDQ